MLGLLITAKMFIYSTPVAIKSYLISAESKKKSVKPYFNSLSFADETLPLGDQRIIKKMNANLKAHSFSKLQTSKLHRQAEKWFPIIEPILKQYGIPADFKYVPLVESGLLGGTSPKGASGHWQFMPQTARDFGLQVDDELDERQNMRKSTIAAAKYIKSLYREFDSWTLAAAAYNIGEGSLKRQMQKQQQDNYFKMKLNRETASYVYKLISMKEIIENPNRYGYNSRSSKLLANEGVAGKSLFDDNTGVDHTLFPKVLKN